MAVRLSRPERLRGERRGFLRFVEAERDRLSRGVYSEDDEDHVERKIAEYETRIAGINEEIGEQNAEVVLDEERSEIQVEDMYSSDDEARAEEFASADEGNRYWRDLRVELNDAGNRDARVEVQVVEDLASEGITRQDIYDVVEEYEELQEELWKMYDVE